MHGILPDPPRTPLSGRTLKTEWSAALSDKGGTEFQSNDVREEGGEMFGRKTARALTRALADMASRLDLAEKRLDRLDGGTERTVLVSTEGGVFEMTVPPALTSARR